MTSPDRFAIAVCWTARKYLVIKVENTKTTLERIFHMTKFYKKQTLDHSELKLKGFTYKETALLQFSIFLLDALAFICSHLRL
jgi:hypothetical protein